MYISGLLQVFYPLLFSQSSNLLPLILHGLFFLPPLLLFLHSFLLTPPFPLHLFSLPLFSSAMFLASRCLTYFLRLLQCSPPLYHENTLTVKFSITLLPLPSYQPPPPPPTPSVPGKQDRTSGTCSGCSLIGWAPESLNMYKSGQRGEFCPEVLCSYFFYVTVAIIACNDVNDVSNITTDQEHWYSLEVMKLKCWRELEMCRICLESEFYPGAVLLELSLHVYKLTRTQESTNRKQWQNCSTNVSSM